MKRTVSFLSVVTFGVACLSSVLIAQQAPAAQQQNGSPAAAAELAGQAPPPATQAVQAPPQAPPGATEPNGLTISGHPANAFWFAHDKQMLFDFGWLAYYRDADKKIGPPAPGEKRVVFMGDSITEGWHFNDPGGSFAGKGYINRGIHAQTTPEMLVRFRQDVIDLQPKVVVILAGTNDFASITGPMTMEQTEENLESMTDLATANHIKVILCSLLPAFDYPWRPGVQPASKIVELNAWIKDYAAQKGYIYVDYHTAMKDQRNGLAATLSKDGVHPNDAGHVIMARLLEPAIEKALAE